MSKITVMITKVMRIVDNYDGGGDVDDSLDHGDYHHNHDDR